MSNPVSPKTLLLLKERGMLEARIAAQTAINERNFGTKKEVVNSEESKTQGKTKKYEKAATITKSTSPTVTSATPEKLTPSSSEPDIMPAEPQTEVLRLLTRKRQLERFKQAQDIYRQKIHLDKAEALRMLRATQRQRHIEADIKAKALREREAPQPESRFAVPPTSIPVPTLKIINDNKNYEITSKVAKTDTVDEEDEVWEDICFGFEEEVAEMEMEADDDNDWVML